MGVRAQTSQFTALLSGRTKHLIPLVIMHQFGISHRMVLCTNHGSFKFLVWGKGTAFRERSGRRVEENFIMMSEYMEFISFHLLKREFL